MIDHDKGVTSLACTYDEPPRFVVSGRSLKLAAALVWYVGGIVLLLKGGNLLAEAEGLKPGAVWPWLGMVAGLFLGALKAKYLFRESCQKNLDRIAALERPRLWQFFSPRFFVGLTMMISVGVMLSRLAHNWYPLLIGVVLLDFGVGVALLGSSYVFWKKW